MNDHRDNGRAMSLVVDADTISVDRDRTASAPSGYSQSRSTVNPTRSP